ncbi:MAG: PepSY domain-containing protein [Arenicella sp.]
MKFRFLILLLLFSGAAYSDDSTQQSVESEDPKKGDTIWLEEKISPTTTWIENLVKPVTVWMEQKINEPEQEVNKQESSQNGEQGSSSELNETEPVDMEAASIISAKQASALAKNHIAGDVLYIKLLSKTNQYRVKLISKVGEIHIIYIKAVSGEIVLPDDKTSIEPAKQINTEQGNQTNSVSDSDRKSGDKP